MSKVRIGDIGNVVTGKTPKTADLENYGNEYLFISPTELHKNFIITDSEKKISKKGLESIKSNTISGLSILVGCIGWDMGNVALSNETCATNQQINAITSIKKDFNPYYIYYWLKGKKEFLFKIANVTRTPILKKSDFSNIEIEIPSKQIQDKISNVLVNLDRKIENNKIIISELESMVKTIYDYWFLQYEFPNEEGKPYKSSGGKIVYNEKLKMGIPECWKVIPSKDIVEVITGKEDANFATINGKYKFFTCSQDTSSCDIPKFKGSAVLIAGNGDFNVKHYTGEFNAYQRTYVLMPNEIKYYGLLYISSLYKIKSFQHGSNGSIVKFITKGDIENIELKIPDNEELLKKLNQYIFTIEKINNENEELINLRDYLLPLLMNGQVSFKN